jgi:uncharacterized protein
MLKPQFVKRYQPKKRTASAATTTKTAATAALTDAAPPAFADHAAAFSPKHTAAFVLTDDDLDEALDFLRQRPVHTVMMMSFINDNGLSSCEMNRGLFYGSRAAADGPLDGMALIGHTTLVEARSENALRALAAAARKSAVPIKLMMSDGKNIEAFWRYFSAGDCRPPRLTCEERLFQISAPFLVRHSDWNVRPAAAAELEPVAAAHAEIAFAESGINPLEADREGFLRRARRRICLGRTFVVFENERLIFKADIAAETDDVIYLEGIYVAPEERGRGVGSQCLAKLTQRLLQNTRHVCLLSNVRFAAAHRSYLKAGFHSEDCCTTIFV